MNPTRRNGKPDLRERLRGSGSASLSDAALVALVLGTGQRGERVDLTATRLLSAAGGLHGLAELEAVELERLPAVGPARAARLCAAFELGRRLAATRLRFGDELRSPYDSARNFRGLMAGAKREEFHVLLVDTRHRVVGHRLVSVGSLQSSIVHPREVFRPAIRAAAAAIVAAHNHPSGDPTPSPEDRAVTERLREAGALLGIELLDHLVLGEREFYTFAEGRVLELAP